MKQELENAELKQKLDALHETQLDELTQLQKEIQGKDWDKVQQPKIKKLAARHNKIEIALIKKWTSQESKRLRKLEARKK